jgi:hypothetical protein
MSNTTLTLHSGGKQVLFDDLAAIKVPEPTDTWFPVGHAEVIETVKHRLGMSGFRVNTERYALAKDGARMFATLDLDSTLAEGVCLAVGVRNSFDKSFPLGFAAGSRVFVCDNLAFSSELMIAHKHTKHGHERFGDGISFAVTGLSVFKDQESARIELMKRLPLDERHADSIILRAFEAGVVSSRMLPDVISEWRNPSYPDFVERNAWSLYNAFTTAMGQRAKTNPVSHAQMTIALGGLFSYN